MDQMKYIAVQKQSRERTRSKTARKINLYVEEKKQNSNLICQNIKKMNEVKPDVYLGAKYSHFLKQESL